MKFNRSVFKICFYLVTGLVLHPVAALAYGDDPFPGNNGWRQYVNAKIDNVNIVRSISPSHIILNISRPNEIVVPVYFQNDKEMLANILLLKTNNTSATFVYNPVAEPKCIPDSYCSTNELLYLSY